MDFLRRIAFSFAIMALPDPSWSNDELVLGRWCDTWFPGSSHELVIRVDGGNVIAAWQFTGGSSLEQELVEKGEMVFLVSERSSGDGYRIVSSSGNLQIFDDDGIIREAVRLENDPQSDECIKD